MPESENALWAKTRRRNMAANRRRTERSQAPAPPRRFPRPGVHPVAPFLVHRFCAPAGAPFLKGHHKFALWNDTIALRLKNRVAPFFCSPLSSQTVRQKQRPPGSTLARRQKPHARIVGQRQAPRRRTERSESAAHAKERRKPALLLLTSRLAIVYNYKRAVYNLICLWR